MELSDQIILINELISNSKFRLNSGNGTPRLGFGVYQLPAGETTLRVVEYALKIGYRHIDTAKLYGNKADIGSAVMKRLRLIAPLTRGRRLDHHLLKKIVEKILQKP